MPAGRPPKYDANFHPDELIRLMSQGLFLSEVAAEWDLATETLHEWTHSHPEFSQAYKKALAKKEHWWFRQLRDNLQNGQKFNTVGWSMAMRHHGVSTDQRMIKLPDLNDCETFDDKTKVVQKALSEGRIGAKEAKDLMDAIASQAKVHENTEMKQMLEEIQNAQKQK